MLCARRNGREKNVLLPRKTERGERERWSCWIFSKKFHRALSPKQIARVRRTERTSLSFPRFRHNCGDRAPRSDRTGARPTGPTTLFRRRHGRVVAAKKIWAQLTGGVHAKCGERWKNGIVRRIANRVSATREFLISRGHYGPDFEPRSWRVINMGRRIADDNDGYVPRFRLAPLLFSTRVASSTLAVSTRKKLGVRSVTSGCGP